MLGSMIQIGCLLMLLLLLLLFTVHQLIGIRDRIRTCIGHGRTRKDEDEVSRSLCSEQLSSAWVRRAELTDSPISQIGLSTRSMRVLHC